MIAGIIAIGVLATILGVCSVFLFAAAIGAEADKMVKEIIKK